jgi:hypothetical protein
MKTQRIANVRLYERYAKAFYSEAVIDRVLDATRGRITRAANRCWNKALDHGGGTVFESCEDTGLIENGEPVHFCVAIAALADGTVKLAEAFIGRPRWVRGFPRTLTAPPIWYTKRYSANGRHFPGGRRRPLEWRHRQDRGQPATNGAESLVRRPRSG